MCCCFRAAISCGCSPPAGSASNRRLVGASCLEPRASASSTMSTITPPNRQSACGTKSTRLSEAEIAPWPRMVIVLSLSSRSAQAAPPEFSLTMTSDTTVFLVDVDNTLIDNDRIQADLRRHLEREFGAACRDRYWTILEQLFGELGYRDYLGALQRYRVEHPKDIHLLSMSSYLVDYPFANRLYPGALDVLEQFRGWARTVILSDGDVVFQPRKVERSGIFETVDGHVLIYIHKEEELEDVAQRYPARHYVLVDDKPRILAAVKKLWGDRVTTVLPRQGQFAHAADAASYRPAADLMVERISDLLAYDFTDFIPDRYTSGSERRSPTQLGD